MTSSLSQWEEGVPSAGLANASQAPPADETGAVYAALSAGALEYRLSAFRPESCQKPVRQCNVSPMRTQSSQGAFCGERHAELLQAGQPSATEKSLLGVHAGFTGGVDANSLESRET